MSSGTLAGSATQPIFDGFTLLHQKRAAEDAYDQAAATYRSTVIGALQNVADTLHALDEDASALKAAVEWEHAAKVALDLTRQHSRTLRIEQATINSWKACDQSGSHRLGNGAAEPKMEMPAEREMAPMAFAIDNR